MTAARSSVADGLRHATARLPHLLAPGHRLLVGYSGGQDSTCLLHALAERGLDLVAAHVDHGLRPESAEQAARVVEIARSFGVRCLVQRLDLAAYRAMTGWGIQQAARAARYQVLAASVAEADAEALLVAHTADDQAETVLLNLLRGSGLAGLAGMRLDEIIEPARLGPPVAEVKSGQLGQVRVARPLLRVWRATTLAYCQELGLPRVEDPSNQSRAYRRNRLRLELMPLLETFNPGIRGVLARLADLAGEDDAALEEVVEVLHARLAQAVEPGVLAYGLDDWRSQPRGLQRRLLRRGLRELLGDLVDVPAAPIEDALDLVRVVQPGQAYHLPGGVELCAINQTQFVLRLHGRARPPLRPKTWGIAPPRV